MLSNYAKKREIEIKLLDVSFLLTSKEKLIFGFFKDALSEVKKSKNQKLLYACGGWVRDKLFFIENHGILMLFNQRLRLYPF